jgi:hypothetical protein
MNEKPGFDFGETEAAHLVERLQKALVLLNDSVAYADAHCDPKVVAPFRKWIAEIMTDLGWAVLEQGFYKKYPNLRPSDSTLR